MLLIYIYLTIVLIVKRKWIPKNSNKYSRKISLEKAKKKNRNRKRLRLHINAFQSTIYLSKFRTLIFQQKKTGIALRFYMFTLLMV